MPKVPDSHRQERRNQILHAAWRCYERQGFHRTSVRDICEEAGLSIGAVYSYFDGKQEILEAVADEGWSDSEALMEGLEGADSARRACLEFLETALPALETEAGRRSARVDLRLRAEALDIDHLRERGLERIGAWRESLAEHLEAAEGGERTPGEETSSFEEVADVLVALLVGAQTLTALDPDSDPTAVLRGVRALTERPGTGQEGSEAESSEE